MLQRADRYLLRELLWPLLFGTVLATLLIIALKLVGGIDSIARNHMPIASVARIIGYDIPNVVVMSLPVAVALASSLAVNRLARDREITVIRGSGRSLIRLFAPIAIVGVLVAAGNFLIADRLVPWAWRASRGLPSLTAPLRSTEDNQAFRTGDYVIAYARSQAIDDNRRQLTGVTIVRRGTDPAIFTAPTAEYAPGALTLSAAVVHRYDAQGYVTREERRPSLSLPVTIDFSPSGAFGFAIDELANLSFAELTRAAREADRRGEAGKKLQLETARWFKVALPTLCAVFALCAPPISLAFSRAGSLAGVLLSLVLVFVGWNTHLFLRAISLGGWLPPYCLAFTTHTLFLIAGLIFLRTQE